VSSGSVQAASIDWAPVPVTAGTVIAVAVLSIRNSPPSLITSALCDAVREARAQMPVRDMSVDDDAETYSSGEGDGASEDAHDGQPAESGSGASRLNFWSR